MASVPTGLVFKMILSPSAAMYTACASVAHGVVVGLEVQAVSSHKTEPKKNRKLKQ
jgi:Na+-transporting NADH:ubiquinone oxidoreductase subunit NqrB